MPDLETRLNNIKEDRNGSIPAITLDNLLYGSAFIAGTNYPLYVRYLLHQTEDIPSHMPIAALAAALEQLSDPDVADMQGRNHNDWIYLATMAIIEPLAMITDSDRKDKKSKENAKGE